MSFTQPIPKSQWETLVAALQEISREMPLSTPIEGDEGDDGHDGAYSNGSDYASYIDAKRARKALKAVGIKPEGDDPEPLCRCQNCLWAGHRSELETDVEDGNVPDLNTRVAPGEPMPVGECPECQSLCHFEPDPDATTELSK